MIKLILMTTVVVVLAGGLFITYTQPEILPTPLKSFAPTVKNTVDQVVQKSGALVSKGKDAGPAVLGVKSESEKIFQEDDSDKPIQQKAMEFTQYQYCKMIVKSYEEEHEPSSSPSASPAQSSKN